MARPKSAISSGRRASRSSRRSWRVSRTVSRAKRRAPGAASAETTEAAVVRSTLPGSTILRTYLRRGRDRVRRRSNARALPLPGPLRNRAPRRAKMARLELGGISRPCDSPADDGSALGDGRDRADRDRSGPCRDAGGRVLVGGPGGDPPRKSGLAAAHRRLTGEIHQHDDDPEHHPDHLREVGHPTLTSV